MIVPEAPPESCQAAGGVRSGTPFLGASPERHDRSGAMESLDLVRRAVVHLRAYRERLRDESSREEWPGEVRHLLGRCYPHGGEKLQVLQVPYPPLKYVDELLGFLDGRVEDLQTRALDDGVQIPKDVRRNGPRAREVRPLFDKVAKLPNGAPVQGAWIHRSLGKADRTFCKSHENTPGEPHDPYRLDRLPMTGPRRAVLYSRESVLRLLARYLELEYSELEKLGAWPPAAHTRARARA